MSKDPNFQTGKVVAQWDDEVDAEMPLTDRLALLSELSTSEDPTDRAKALALVQTLYPLVTLPAGTWAVLSRDNHGQETVWSAHYTEEQALVWMPEWKRAMEARGVYTWSVGQRDDIHADLLRNAGAVPEECIL